MIGYIYITYCPKDRIYIGQRRKNKFDKSYIGSGKIIKDMMKKYDKYKDFKCEILYECNTVDELNSKEIEMIQKYKSLYKDKCINILRGGQIHTEKGMFPKTDINYYSIHPVPRGDFKNYCKRFNLDYDNFDEFHVANRLSNKNKLYVYKPKVNEKPIRNKNKEKPIEYWSENSVSNKIFKRYCQRNNLNYGDFEKIYHKNSDSEPNRKLYYFISKR